MSQLESKCVIFMHFGGGGGLRGSRGRRDGAKGQIFLIVIGFHDPWQAAK